LINLTQIEVFKLATLDLDVLVKVPMFHNCTKA